MVPDPATALDRPDPVRELADIRLIAANPASSVAYRPPPRTPSSAVITPIVTDRLGGSIPITTRLLSSFISFSDARSITGCRAGTATLLRAGQSPLEPLLTLATPGSRRPDESHTTSEGSRNESDDPGAWTEPRQAPVLGQWNKQPMRGADVRSLLNRVVSRCSGMRRHRCLVMRRMTDESRSSSLRRSSFALMNPSLPGGGRNPTMSMTSK